MHCDDVFDEIRGVCADAGDERRQDGLIRQLSDRSEEVRHVVLLRSVQGAKARHLRPARQKRPHFRQQQQRIARLVFVRADVIDDRPRPLEVRSAARVQAVDECNQQDERPGRDDCLFRFRHPEPERSEGEGSQDTKGVATRDPSPSARLRMTRFAVRSRERCTGAARRRALRAWPVRAA